MKKLLKILKMTGILLLVHGGPCCSEIPYVRKYQKNLEKDFTIVHYDQRGSGKSYEFGEDDSTVTAAAHRDDLIALTEYIREYLGQEQVILIGHSYGTYIATIAAAEQEKDVLYLKSLKTAISGGKRITPRSYVRKYGFAARGIDDNADYLKGFLPGPEYNLLDAARYYFALRKYQGALMQEAINMPLTDIVTEMNVPVYFVMGKYDGMTSPEVAEEYFAQKKALK